MADIVSRNPFVGMRQRWTVSSTTPSSTSPTRAASTSARSPVDISEADGALKVRASLPGSSAEDIDVQVHEGVLSSNAKHVEDTERTDDHYYRRERHLGSVSQCIALPGVVRDAEVDVEFADGVLSLTIPLPEQAQPKQIEIRGS